MGFPGGTSSKESACQYRRCKSLGFDPWVGKIPWSGKWLLVLALVFLPRKLCGQRSLAGHSPRGHKELDTTEHPCTRVTRVEAAGEQFPRLDSGGLEKQHPPKLEGEEGRQGGLGGGCNGKGYWHGLQRRKRTSPSARSAQSRERKRDEKRPRGKGLKTSGVGTFLVVQWLRVLFPMQGAWVRSLARELDLKEPV